MKLFLQGMSLISMIGVLVILIWRIISSSDVFLSKKNPEIKRVPAGKITPVECAKIFVYSMLFRIFVLIIGFVIYCLFIENGETFQWSNLYNNWLKWDASNYIRISDGYTSYMEDGEYPTIVFFPLYSYLIKILRFIIPNAVVAGLIVSAVLSSFACVFMYKMVCLDYSKKTAKTAVLLMCLFPFSFFFSAIMSESAFLLTSIMTLYYARNGSWKLAGICGLCASLSRSIGVFLIVPLFICLIEQNQLFGNIKNKKIWAKTLKEGLFLLLLPMGILIYLFINFSISKDPFYFLAMEEKFWHQTSQPFFITVGTFWDIITKGHYQPSFLVASFIPGFVMMIFSYVVLISSATKHNTMYVAWLMISIIVNSSMSWPLSFCRYMACAVPLYIFIADECEKRENIKLSIFISWSILFSVYLVGYLMYKQIM